MIAKDGLSAYVTALARGRLLDGRGGSELELFDALRCVYADRWDYAADFCKRCLKAVEWSETSGALTSPKCEPVYPFHLAQVRLYRLYAHWLLGRALDRGGLHTSAGLAFEWLYSSREVERGRPINNPISHEWCIGTLRAAMISGDVALARTHLNRLELKWYMEDQRLLYLRLIDEYPKPSQQLRSDFERWFNLCRDPDAKEWHVDLGQIFSMDMTRFEVGIIRQMYLVNARLDDPVDAHAVIEAIRA